MKINWLLRFKNKATCTAVVLQVISIIYQILAACNIAPSVGQSVVVAIAESIIGLLVLGGVLIDPSTPGVGDSKQVMQRTEPCTFEPEE